MPAHRVVALVVLLLWGIYPSGHALAGGDLSSGDSSDGAVQFVLQNGQRLRPDSFSVDRINQCVRLVWSRTSLHGERIVPIGEVRLVEVGTVTHVVAETARDGVHAAIKVSQAECFPEVCLAGYRWYQPRIIEIGPQVSQSDATVPPGLGRGMSSESIVNIQVKAESVSLGGKLDRDGLKVVVLAAGPGGMSAGCLPGTTCSVTLWGASQQLVAPYPGEYFESPGRTRVLARWTKQLSTERDVCWTTTDGQKLAVLDLPLPTPLPDHDLRIFGWGVVEVEMAVPGQGVFASFSDPLRLRSDNFLPATRLTETGSRFSGLGPTSDSPMTFGPPNSLRSGLSPARGIFAVQP